MKRLFKFRYPKLALLVFTIVLSYMIFSNEKFSGEILQNLNLGYVGFFIAGLLFSFGFTAAFGVGYFLTVPAESLFLASAIGALGSLVANMIIFKIVRESFMDEFVEIENTSPFKYLIKEFDLFFHKKIRLYILYATIGLVLASPLPDEIGVLMMSGLTVIETKKLAVLSFLTHFIGIFLIMLI